jgi:hypothetical protein
MACLPTASILAPNAMVVCIKFEVSCSFYCKCDLAEKNIK